VVGIDAELENAISMYAENGLPLYVSEIYVMYYMCFIWVIMLLIVID
jgi:hypothetical protein